jgi:hypothetical protein
MPRDAFARKRHPPISPWLALWFFAEELDRKRHPRDNANQKQAMPAARRCLSSNHKLHLIVKRISPTCRIALR